MIERDDDVEGIFQSDLILCTPIGSPLLGSATELTAKGHRNGISLPPFCVLLWLGSDLEQ